MKFLTHKSQDYAYGFKTTADVVSYLCDVLDTKNTPTLEQMKDRNCGLQDSLLFGYIVGELGLAVSKFDFVEDIFPLAQKFIKEKIEALQPLVIMEKANG